MASTCKCITGRPWKVQKYEWKDGAPDEHAWCTIEQKQGRYYLHTEAVSIRGKRIHFYQQVSFCPSCGRRLGTPDQQEIDLGMKPWRY